MKSALAMTAVVLTGLCARAQPSGRDINPGNLGANALPPYAAEGPWVGDRWSASLGLGAQVSSPVRGAADPSVTLPFRLEYPFGRRVALLALGSPLEAFQYSPETQAAWLPSRPGGVVRGDVSLGVRVAIFDGGPGIVPALGVRILLKTATGEDLPTRRFLDAPGYQFDVLVGERVPMAGGRLELALSVGFLSWQQGLVGQNDALAWALKASWERAPFTVRLEARGYRGWQQGDSPMVVAAGFERQLRPWLSMWAGVARGVWDPPGWELSFGLRVGGPAWPRPPAAPTEQPAAPREGRRPPRRL